MKKIGLIGGLSWISTMEYYRLINLGMRNRLGMKHSAEIIMMSMDQQTFDQYAKSGDEESAYQVLAQAAKDLKSLDVDFALLCANGVHRFFDRLSLEADLPMIHIADATALEIKKFEFQKVGLLGIRKTMEEDFYKNRLTRHGIETVVPDEEDRILIDRVIFSELVHGEYKEASRQAYLKVMRNLVEQGAQGIVLGCTEIPLLINKSHTKTPLFATTDIHCIAAVERALS